MTKKCWLLILVILPLMGLRLPRLMMVHATSQTTIWNASEVVAPAGGPRALSFERIFFLDDRRGWVTIHNGGLAYTEDKGTTWHILPSLPEFRHLDAIFFISPTDGWIATTLADGAAGLWLTADGGRQWIRLSSFEGLDISVILSLHFGKDGRGWAVGSRKRGREGVILRTSDGGRKWNLQTLVDSSVLVRLAVDAPDQAWAGGQGILLSTLNGGQNWRVVYESPLDAIRALAPLTPDGLIAVGDMGLALRTKDRGITWEKTKLPGPYDRLWLGGVYFMDAERGWLGGEKGKILATTDSGTTWSLEAEIDSYFIRDIQATSERIFAIGDDGAIFWRLRPK